MAAETVATFGCEPRNRRRKLGKISRAKVKEIAEVKLKDLNAALRKLGENYNGFLAVTDGPDGVYWLDASEVRHMAAFKVNAIDTLGAGDTFHGAFALHLVETGDVVASMRFAAAAAAIKCTRFGGLMGAPSRAEVDDFLMRHPG